jgi:4-amino-4-deoxy-L-arabinose transferase-like glycosyltransferase
MAPSLRKKYSLKAIFWLIAIMLGALQAWINRYKLSTDDIIAYLDIGDAYLQGNWQDAINGYWSPLYSWILALSLSVLKPSAYWEFPSVKLINFLIYLLTLACFDFFVRELIVSYQEKLLQDSPNTWFNIPKWAWIVLAYTLFLLSSLQWIGISSDTPDMCVAAIVYLASALVLRIHRQSKSWLNYFALGAVLGLGYLAKTAMFPISFVFLGVALFSVGNLRRAILPILASILVFTAISAPFLVAISTARGHPTFGDSGKLNYAWLVTEQVKPYRFWQGQEPGSGTPKHPPRKIFDNPKVFEFATPIGGTYPPWHDPSYWYEGLLLKFNPVKHIKVLLKNAFYYYEIFLGGLIFGYLIIVTLSGNLRLAVKQLKKNWMLIIPAAAGLGIYMIGIDMPVAHIETQPSTRYIAPFIVLLFAGIFSTIRLPNSQESKKLITGISLATFLLIAVPLPYQTTKGLWTGVTEQQQHIHWYVADRLHQLGLQPGEKVAVLGHYVHPHYHWARLAKVKIVAEIVEADVFWAKTAAVRSEILKKIENTGAKVIVQKMGIKIPDSVSGWQKIGKTDYYAYFFQR